jgi:hypothetical protein
MGWMLSGGDSIFKLKTEKRLRKRSLPSNNDTAPIKVHDTINRLVRVNPFRGPVILDESVYDIILQLGLAELPWLPHGCEMMAAKTLFLCRCVLSKFLERAFTVVFCPSFYLPLKPPRRNPWLYDFLWLFMNVYECLWLFMNVYECLWIGLTFYDFLWIGLT